MKTNEIEIILGHEIELPKVFPCSFKEFLRRVIGRRFPSANKEGERTHLYRQFLADYGCFSDFNQHRYSPDGRVALPDKDLARFPAWSAEKIASIIGKKKARGFNRDQFVSAAEMFLTWADGARQLRIRAERRKAGSKGGRVTVEKRQAKKARLKRKAKKR